MDKDQVMLQPLGYVEAGDEIIRIMGGAPVTLTVEKVDEKFIYAKGGWKFDRYWGYEVDEELGWGVNVDDNGLPDMVWTYIKEIRRRSRAPEDSTEGPEPGEDAP